MIVSWFGELSDEHQQEIVSYFWPYQVEQDKIFTLRLSKRISKMTIKELQIELRKRGKEIDYKRKIDLQNRLRKFHSCQEIKEFQIAENEKLIIGFVRNMGKKFNMNIPYVITNMIHKYSPYQTVDQLLNKELYGIPIKKKQPKYKLENTWWCRALLREDPDYFDSE